MEYRYDLITNYVFILKILQVINSLGTGGAEKLLLETIPLYRKAGVEMDILLLWNNNHQFTENLIRMNICKVYILNQSKNLKDVYNPINIFKMRKIMKNYQLVHVHLFPAQYFAVIANKLNRNHSRLIFTEHNTTNNRVEKIIYKPIEKWIYSHYSRLICISDEIKMIYQNYLNFKDDRLIIINNGIDISKYTRARQLEKSQIVSGISDDDTILIQVSSFRPQKDQETLIRAMNLLPQNYKLLLVGTGERKIILEQLVKELGILKRIYFLGQRMDIPQLLKSADIVVLSSHYEGLSLSSIEGLASGRPFLASNVPGLQEIVNDAGILFKKGDEKELAKIVMNLIENPDYAKNISQKGIIRAKQYDIHLMLKKHIELYQDLIN